MILLGALLIRSDGRKNVIWPGRLTWGVHLLGILLALYVFMADSLYMAREGFQANYYRPPAQFDWPLFILSLGMIAGPVITMLRQSWQPGERSDRHETYSDGGML